MENAAVERELLPSAPLRENQEFETDAPPGHRSTAALSVTKYIRQIWQTFFLFLVFDVQPKTWLRTDFKGCCRIAGGLTG